MKEPAKQKAQFGYGGYGPEEQSLVGNEAGIKAMISALEEALETGEAEGVGEIASIILKPEDWEPETELETDGVFGTTVFVIVVSLFFFF